MNPAVRRLVRETALGPSQLVLPLFVRPGRRSGRRSPPCPATASSRPTCWPTRSAQAAELGLGGVLLFGIPAEKDAAGSDAMSDAGIIPQAVRAVKQAAPDLLVITDVCFCEYTDHGHCGALAKPAGRVDVDNDATLAMLGQPGRGPRPGRGRHGRPQRHDGRHGRRDPPAAGRGGLRPRADHELRGQVRQRAFTARSARRPRAPRSSATAAATRWTRPPAAGQALREVELDLAEGADMVMVKPALAYLDIIRLVRDRFPGVPLAAYNVSGEYSMIKAAARQGWLDERAVALEILTAIRRAGAGIILTYWAKEAAAWLRG